MVNGKPDMISKAIRLILSILDSISYWLLECAYQIFFVVSGVEFFTNQTIRDIFARVQLVLGVFMVFKLTITIVQAIANPDLITDKQNGFSKIISRVILCLIMLVALVPINMPNPRNTFERQINNNGILFGTLYDLQSRVLKQNVIGKIIIGNDTSKSTNGDLSEVGKKFSVTFLKAFVQIDSNCTDQKIIDNYQKADEPGDLLGSEINTECGSVYAYSYTPIIGGIAAIICAVVFFSFTVDIAIRACKIAFLRLLAPIPIISYMEPEQAKKGAFANWVKILTSTYIDLFVRLAIIYFVLFIISDIMENGLIGLDFSGDIGGIAVNTIAFIFVVIGLLLFASQAPKFIRDTLGLQGTMSNIGLAGLLGGTAMAAGGGGLAGFGLGMLNGARAQIQGNNQGKPVPLGSAWSQNSDLMAKIRTGDKDAQGGFIGRANDFLNYQARERRARMMGMGAYHMADAKFMMDQYEALNIEAQNRLKKAELDYQHDPSQANLDAYNAAQKLAATTGTYFAKAQKRYKAMDEGRAQLGVNPRVIDTREFGTHKTGTYRSAFKAFGTELGDPDNDAEYNRIFDELNNGLTMEKLDSQFREKIGGQKRDPKGFEGTVDDSTFASTGHGGRVRRPPSAPPGGGPPPRP